MRGTGVIAEIPVQPADPGIPSLLHVALGVSSSLLTISCLPSSINGAICILRERELYTFSLQQKGQVMLMSIKEVQLFFTKEPNVSTLW